MTKPVLYLEDGDPRMVTAGGIAWKITAAGSMTAAGSLSAHAVPAAAVPVNHETVEWAKNVVAAGPEWDGTETVVDIARAILAIDASALEPMALGAIVYGTYRTPTADQCQRWVRWPSELHPDKPWVGQDNRRAAWVDLRDTQVVNEGVA